MQALQYTRTMREIVAEMRVGPLVSFLGPFFAQAVGGPITQPSKDNLAVLLFASRAGFERLMQNPLPRKILESLRIGEIYDPTRLARLMSSIAGMTTSNQIPPNPDFIQFYALLTCLANFAESCSNLLEKEKLEPAKTPDEILELQLVDYEGGGIEPRRLERFIFLLVRLHTNFARILGITDDRLRFIYFDSGSDLLIGIQCAKEILLGISNAISEWWHGTRFRSFETFDKKMEAVSKGLSVLTTVKEAVGKKVITDEEGKLLQTHVMREVDQLIGIGVSQPTRDGGAEVDQRQLLIEKRDIKLLGTGRPPEEGSDSTPV